MAGMTLPDVLDMEVSLSDGAWQGEPAAPGSASRPGAELMPGFRLADDLDGDGREEAAALLSAWGGGSGTFTHLVVAAGGHDGPAQVAVADLGDRVQVRSGRLEDGAIVLAMVQHGPGDAACCPTMKVVRRWRLIDGRLQEQPAVESGSVSLADMGGVTWRLLRLADGTPVPEGVAVTLTLEEDRLAGQSGCNRYFATVTPGRSPQALQVGPLAGTRMACPEKVMALEDRFQADLQAAYAFAFEPGRLRLATLRDGEPGTLIFTSEAP
jgi:heat shock protein HslJ